MDKTLLYCQGFVIVTGLLLGNFGLLLWTSAGEHLRPPERRM